MEKKIFNPWEWISKPEQQDYNINTTSVAPGVQHAKSIVESIIQQIESKQIDITTTYSNWRNIGFAFADEFGENGRDLFHRVSRFYADYSFNECDIQYTNCLKSKGQGVSIKTFFYHVKNAGISTKMETQPPKNTIEEVSHFPETLYSQLPEFLRNTVSMCTSHEERDILLLGTITTLSSCLPNVYGIYDRKRVYPNLFLFVTAIASAGKGVLEFCKLLVRPIHKLLREQAKRIRVEYEILLAEYNLNKGKENGLEKPNIPQEKMLFIPANNSATGVFQLLSDNDGKGLIFETEGDTLTQAFKSDYGNYSDGFRKAFHHETISYFRRTNQEYVDIENPCLSAVLSGTPKQISNLIPDAENGLFSRFIIYFMNIRTDWKNVFDLSSSTGMESFFNNLGVEFYKLHETLSEIPEIEFLLSADQQVAFNDFFSKLQLKYISVNGVNYIATVRRLGLIAFRIAMILSVLRIFEKGEITRHIICDDSDFQSTLLMIKTLVQHSSMVFSELPKKVKTIKPLSLKEKFLKDLPINFNRKEYIEIANAHSISVKNAEYHIKNFIKQGLIHHDGRNKYINISKQVN